MTAYLLDTNIASDALKGVPPRVRERMVELPLRSVMISAITQGELLYGLAKRGNPSALGALIHEFLIRVEVLPWTAEVATTYGALRAKCAARGVPLGALDVMIAAQAVAVGAVLVTRDQAFTHLQGDLTIENWAP